MTFCYSNTSRIIYPVSEHLVCFIWFTKNILATWCKELTHLKRPWCWERLKVEGEGNDRGWGGCMASPTQWTWVWVGCESWWWTGKPGVLLSLRLQRIGHDWASELNWYFILGLKYPRLWAALDLTKPYKQMSRWVQTTLNKLKTCNHKAKHDWNITTPKKMKH